MPALLAAGEAKAAQAGVEVTWVTGNAEELPFDDGTFDRVFSTFGHMFAPRHRQTADEMARVCRRGGTIAICCWTPLMDRFGPFVTATALGDRFADFRADTIAVWEQRNEAEGGGFRLPQEYLVSVVTL